MFFFKTASCFWVLFVGTFGLPGNFVGSGGAVFTRFQKQMSTLCHIHEDGNKILTFYNICNTSLSKVCHPDSNVRPSINNRE